MIIIKKEKQKNKKHTTEEEVPNIWLSHPKQGWWESNHTFLRTNSLGVF